MQVLKQTSAGSNQSGSLGEQVLS